MSVKAVALNDVICWFCKFTIPTYPYEGDVPSGVHAINVNSPFAFVIVAWIPFESEAILGYTAESIPSWLYFQYPGDAATIIVIVCPTALDVLNVAINF